jgi:hypothetical protein
MRMIRLATVVLCAAALGACDGLLGNDGSDEPGVAVDIGHLSKDPTFFPNPAQFSVSSDSRTLYVAGRTAGESDTSIFAFDLGSRELTAIVPHVVGLVRIAAIAGDDILYSLASGEIRRAGRNRTGSEPAVVADGGEPFVVGNNARFVARRLTGTNSEVIDLTTGVRRTALTGDANVKAVSDDGEEVAYTPCCGNPWLVNVSTGAKRQLTVLANSESSLLSVAWVGDTLRALILAGGRESRPDGDYIVAPTLREVDVDHGTKRDLGTERVGLVTWSPSVHRAASVAWYMCKQDGSSLAPCLWHAHNLFKLEQAEARNIGRVQTSKAITTAVMTPDGKRLLYYGNQLMIKALE